MRKVRLYWSNICILHKYEKEVLDRLQVSLREREIDLEITYFGIGYPYRMAEYMMTAPGELPDIIVSTDLEVFEDRRIFDGFRDRLMDLAGDFPVRKAIKDSNIGKWRHLLPFLVIPLAFCSNSQFDKDPAKLSYAELMAEAGVVFGGINNSGAKSVIKTLWDRYGEEKTRAFVRHSQILPMPINAFSQIRTGSVGVGLIPSIYSKTADGRNLFRNYPAEGAIGIPSYICALDRHPRKVILEVLKGLLTEEFCRYFTSEGDLYCCLEGRPENLWVKENGERFLYPGQEWFGRVAPEEFEAFYSELVL